MAAPYPHGRKLPFDRLLEWEATGANRAISPGCGISYLLVKIVVLVPRAVEKPRPLNRLTLQTKPQQGQAHVASGSRGGRPLAV